MSLHRAGQELHALDKPIKTSKNPASVEAEVHQIDRDHGAASSTPDLSHDVPCDLIRHLTPLPPKYTSIAGMTPQPCVMLNALGDAMGMSAVPSVSTRDDLETPNNAARHGAAAEAEANDESRIVEPLSLKVNWAIFADRLVRLKKLERGTTQHWSSRRPSMTTPIQRLRCCD